MLSHFALRPRPMKICLTMKCPNCKNRLPLYAVLLGECRCKVCKGKISSSVILSVTAAILGLAVSGLFSAGYTLAASLAFVFILITLFVIAPFNIKCTIEENGRNDQNK